MSLGVRPRKRGSSKLETRLLRTDNYVHIELQALSTFNTAAVRRGRERKRERLYVLQGH